MSDFYDRLKQSIIDRGVSDAGDRDAVYAQARRSIIRRLWAHQPPLAAEEIDQRLGAYDAAVERIEADLAAAFGEEIEDAGLADDDVVEPDDALEPEDEAIAPAETEEDVAYASGWDDTVETDDLAAEDADPHGISVDDPADDGRQHHRPMPRRSGTFAPYTEPGAGNAQPAGSAREQAPAHDEERRRRVRWSEGPGQSDNAGRSRLPAARTRLGWTLSEQDKVRVLLGAIGVLAVILIGFIVYLVLPSGEEGVTLPIGVRREVSDAATAARIAAEDLPVRRSFVVFQGRDPTLFETTPDNPVRLDSDGEDGYARVASSTAAAGVKALIGPGLAAELAGQRIRVTITARSSGERGAATMRFAYQSGLAISHWQTANLSPEYADVGLVWRLPAMNTSAGGGHYLLIEPGIPGDGTGADIRAIRIDVLAGDGS